MYASLSPLRKVNYRRRTRVTSNKFSDSKIDLVFEENSKHVVAWQIPNDYPASQVNLTIANDSNQVSYLGTYGKLKWISFFLASKKTDRSLNTQRCNPWSVRRSSFQSW